MKFAPPAKGRPQLSAPRPQVDDGLLETNPAEEPAHRS